jgi:flagellar hook assembly protein FlgD
MNEWIDHSKTYYRFKVGSTGLHRISKGQLDSLGIGQTDVTHFQLWKKGEEIPVYTSAQTGSLPENGFIEFWGEKNDGSWENRLYLRPEYQINPVHSLFSDTSVYFLTVNPTGNNKRFSEIVTDTSAQVNIEPYFMHRITVNFNNQYSQGFAALVGSEVYSSSYDNGEGYVSGNITPTTPLSSTLNNLFVANAGPDAKFRYTAAGRTLNTRNIRIAINDKDLDEREMNYYESVNIADYISAPLSLFSTNKAKIDFKNLSAVTNDRMVVGVYELIYPREFDFGGQSIFEFELPASTSENKLVIKSFNHGGVAPVLYDLTNAIRFPATVSISSDVVVVLPPSASPRKMALCATGVNRITSVNKFTVRNFINYKLPANQGNYIIISNPQIYTDPSGVNQVEAYAQYRSSIAGGGYNVLIADINQLIDQFGWGIKNNPLSVKNFLRYARSEFPDKKQYCLIIGKGVSPHLVRNRAGYIIENRRAVEYLNIVPTFGVPSSDVTLASDEGSITPLTHIGRLNVVNATEIQEYLDKIKIYDQQIAVKTCSIDEEMWKKQFMHVGGANDFLGEQIMYYLDRYKVMAEDTLLGAKVFTLQKSSLTNIQVLAGETVSRLFSNGFAFMTYFGHSSAGTLEFNLDNPENYPYSGKFPVFLVNGCNAGNLFLLDSSRLNGSFVLSEKYVVGAPLRGAIAFIASSHLGIVNYLNLYTEEFYHQMTQVSYDKTLGEIITNVVDTLTKRYGIQDFFVRMHAEEIALHGDPAIVLHTSNKSDYAIEAKSVKVVPEFISVADDSYKIKVLVNNLGRVTTDSVFVLVERIRPDNTKDTLWNQNIRYIPNVDSIEIEVDINPEKDKGTNKIIVTLDPENNIDEFCETNNQVTKEFFIYEDEIRPVYPYNYSIINNGGLTFYASTANPISPRRNYYFQIDTTINFTSPLLKEMMVNASGGLVEFQPSGFSPQENYVYYWRVGIKDINSNDTIWNSHSFIYRSDLATGYNQSHYYQYVNNNYNDLVLDSFTRDLKFKNVLRKLKIRTGLFPYFDAFANDIFLDLQLVDKWRCRFNSFSIYVFMPKTIIPLKNTAIGGVGQYGSNFPCGGKNVRNFFEYLMGDIESRNNARLFLENIVPDSALVLIVNQGTGQGGGFAPANTSFISQWMSDTTVYGSGNSIYHTFKKNGLTQVDSFTRNLPFAFLYKKGNPNFVRQFIGEKENDYIDVVVDLPGQLFNGDVETPWLGPMKRWDNFYWEGGFPDGKSANDSSYFQLIGKTYSGIEQVIDTIFLNKENSISFIDAGQYPYLKMKMHAQDSIDVTPLQLDYWRLTGEHVPEGALAPSISFTCKDSVLQGEDLVFTIAFKNISQVAFDSLKLKLILTKNDNSLVEYFSPRRKALISGDTILVSYIIPTDSLQDWNGLFFMVNPDKDQPEQYTFNNFLYKNFFVYSDNQNPWMDVTFDGIHILNGDIVSAKPHIFVKIADDNKYTPILNQDSIVVEIKFPDGEIRTYTLGSDSARLNISDLNAGINEILIDLFPNLYLDGEYELTIRDANTINSNKTLFRSYKISFTVVNAPKISNMFNYPNPFTSSTAFVFTLTGSEVPQNLRIQIMTISGKVVREITKNELGTLRIGRNITEYKWDGTDQYGNQLANGIYLYRVITNLNGKQLDKYERPNDINTDKYFNNGYGKMYLMR